MGVEVFRRHDLSRRGHLTGRNRSRGDNTYHQVQFQDGSSDYVPEYELEIVETEHDDPFWLIEQSRFGRVSDLRRNLSYIQLSGKLSSLVYSMDTTNTDFYPYQFKPVLSFLESPSRGLLIADEVGLGKTIEAGLIWTEMRARYDARRILVICKAMLREKWRDELRDRFGVDASIVDANELLSELKRDPNRIPDGKGLICSIEGIRPPRGWERNLDQSSPRHKLARLLHEQSKNPPIIDLVIIDEAHYLRNRESQNARLGKLIRDVSENVLLLSATPINLKSEDLFNLLNILDPDTFEFPHFFPQVLEANEPLVVARHRILDTNVERESIAECLSEAASHELLSDNLQLKQLVKQLEEPNWVDTRENRVNLADRVDRVNLLRHVVSRTRKVDVTEWKVVRSPHSQFVQLDEDGPEWQFYCDVTESVRSYALNQGINDGFLLASPQRQVSSCMYAAAKSWIDKAFHTRELLYEDLGTDTDPTNELSPLMEHLATTILPGIDLDALRRHDSKFDAFRGVVKDYLSEYPDEKFIVFSFFRGTLRYLEERLIEEGIQCQVLMGGMRENKQDAIHRFRDSATTKVLLSSEVASEGVDLQFCRVIINYDLPWNPMKVEQRIGRLDRIGQKADRIVIWNLGYANTIDHRIYERLFERLEIFTRALGGMEAILGEEIQSLAGYLLSHNLTPQEEEKRIEQTAIAIETNRRDQDQLEKTASNLIAHGGYILERVRSAHDLKKRITEEDLVVYVSDYLKNYAPGHKFFKPESEGLRFDIQLPPQIAAALDIYIQDKRLYGQSTLASGESVRCEFVNKISHVTGSIEQISQFHPLIRFISKEIKSRGEYFFPAVAVKYRLDTGDIGLELPTGQYAFAIRKWEFNGLRDEEDLKGRVVHLENSHSLSAEDSWKLLNAVRLEGKDWPEAATEAAPELADLVFDCVHYLENAFAEAREAKSNENSDRVNFQIQSAERARDRQINVREQVIENYLARGETRMIPAEKGHIEKIRSNFGVQIEVLRNKSGLDARNLPVCCGVLLLE